jgi:hypothetical protein
MLVEYHHWHQRPISIHLALRSPFADIRLRNKSLSIAKHKKSTADVVVHAYSSTKKWSRSRDRRCYLLLSLLKLHGTQIANNIRTHILCTLRRHGVASSNAIHRDNLYVPICYYLYTCTVRSLLLVHLPPNKSDTSCSSPSLKCSCCRLPAVLEFSDPPSWTDWCTFCVYNVGYLLRLGNQRTIEQRASTAAKVVGHSQFIFREGNHDPPESIWMFTLMCFFVGLGPASRFGSWSSNPNKRKDVIDNFLPFETRDKFRTAFIPLYLKSVNKGETKHFYSNLLSADKQEQYNPPYFSRLETVAICLPRP